MVRLASAMRGSDSRRRARVAAKSECSGSSWVPSAHSQKPARASISSRACAALESALGDYGLDAVPAADRLADLLAVQNTYLATFQSLGGLGLLLGTLGLAVVQLRNVLERRGELALMRSVGFRRRRLSAMVLLESALLLLLGLAVGCTAALVAVLPHWLAGGAAAPWQSA